MIEAMFKRIVYPPLHFLQGRPGAKALMDFCHQLAIMLSAGMPLLPALLIAAQHAQNHRLRLAIRSAIYSVEQGRSLAEALAREPRIFSAFFTNMVEAGEIGGVLDQALQRLAFHYERKNDLEQKIKTATAYPKFVLLIIVGVVIFLLTFVIPAFAATFAVIGVELPLATSIVIALGEWMGTYWHLLAGGAAVIYLLLRQMLRTSWGTLSFSYLKLHLPLYGQLHRKLLVARFCRTLGAMLSSGIGLLRALELAKNVVQNRFFALRIDRVK
ncbi:MAG TPA: type II secretion system protein GspF, partial [Firmicutes bacterium]|nr:type II secretion system protein GspF [Bacillota bacterium]